MRRKSTRGGRPQRRQSYRLDVMVGYIYIEEMMPKVQEEIYLEIDDEGDAEATSHNLGAPPAIGLASKAVTAVVLLHLTLQR